MDMSVPIEEISKAIEAGREVLVLIRDPSKIPLLKVKVHSLLVREGGNRTIFPGVKMLAVLPKHTDSVAWGFLGWYNPSPGAREPAKNQRVLVSEL